MSTGIQVIDCPSDGGSNILTNAIDTSQETLGQVSNAGKQLLDRFSGKGIIGAVGGFAASKLLFKSQSPIMAVALAGGGFLAERFLSGRLRSNSGSSNRFDTNETNMDDILQQYMPTAPPNECQLGDG